VCARTTSTLASGKSSWAHCQHEPAISLSLGVGRPCRPGTGCDRSVARPANSTHRRRAHLNARATAGQHQRVMAAGGRALPHRGGRTSAPRNSSGQRRPDRRIVSSLMGTSCHRHTPSHWCRHAGVPLGAPRWRDDVAEEAAGFGRRQASAFSAAGKIRGRCGRC
jgi:hypothetical protein